MSDEEDEYEYEYNEDEDDGNNDDVINEDNNEYRNEEGNQFEYTNEDEHHDDPQVILENAYYDAKVLREVDLNQAAIAFENVIQQEQIELEKSSSNNNQKAKYGPWSFKSMKQLVKIHLRAAASHSYHQATTKLRSSSNNTNDKTTGSPAMILHHYNRLLECVSVGDVSPAAVEKGISGMLERVARSYGTNNSNIITNSCMKMKSTSAESAKSTEKDMKGLAVYNATLTVFHPLTGPCKNERLWFKTNLKYGQLLYEMKETTKLQQVLNDLLLIHNHSNDKQHGNNTMNSPNVGAAGSTKCTDSLEIYALQIQLYSRQKDHKKLRETYQRAIKVMGGIPHPRTLALIHELGGKMHMSSREYELAGKTFFQAFKSYDEAGDISRLRCLKYLVLVSMFHSSTINPFDSQEAGPYRDDPEIVTMTELVSAFRNNETQKFEVILKKNSKQLLGDEFIREHLDDLLGKTRTQLLHRGRVAIHEAREQQAVTIAKAGVKRVAIHEAREQQTVTIAKAGVKRTVVSDDSDTESLFSSMKKCRKVSNGAENLRINSNIDSELSLGFQGLHQKYKNHISPTAIQTLKDSTNAKILFSSTKNCRKNSKGAENLLLNSNIDSELALGFQGLHQKYKNHISPTAIQMLKDSTNAEHKRSWLRYIKSGRSQSVPTNTPRELTNRPPLQPLISTYLATYFAPRFTARP